MDFTYISRLCTHIYQFSSIPLFFYNTEQQCLFPQTTWMSLEPTAFSLENLIRPFIPELFHLAENPGYLLSKSNFYIGIIKVPNADGCLITGPVISTPMSKSNVKLILRECMISLEHEKSLASFFQTLPLFSMQHFFEFLALLHFLLNTESLDVYEHFHLKISGQSKLLERHTESSCQAKEEQLFHHSYEREMQMLKYVETGNLQGIQSLKNAFTDSTPGILADTPLRQAKNEFIAAIALVTRSSIKGGLGIEEAYQLSDTYIQEIETYQTVDAVYRTYLSMYKDFTDRVASSKIPEGISRQMYSCIQFIQEHTNEHIGVTDVAEHIRRSRSYTSSRFKAEMGFTLNSFIMACKLEEAKSLLWHSDKSLGEISNYLCFSSQSHFQKAFKQKYHLTPNEYRNQMKLD